jgi:PKD repeat protein
MATVVLASALSAAFVSAASAATLSLSVYSYQNPSVPYQTVELYASAYGDCSITRYAWNFGDSSATSGPSAYSVYHSWSTTGSKTVTVTVTDSCGNSTTTTLTQTVVADKPPVAAFTTTVSSTNPLKIYADPADSSDTDPTGLHYYEWNWGDGSWSGTYETSNNGGLASHTYAKAGTYSVTLYAYDTDWNKGQVTNSVTVGPSTHARSRAPQQTM